MDFRMFYEENRKLVTGIALLLSAIVIGIAAGTIIHNISVIGEAKDLKETLMSEEWVRYETRSTGPISIDAGLKLTFQDERLVYNFTTDPGKVMGLDSMKKVKNEGDPMLYSVKDGHTIVVTGTAKTINETVTFEEDGKVMVLSPSLTDTDESKKWYRKSYFLEKYPGYDDFFE